MVFAKPIAAAIRDETGAARVGCAVVGVDVPHAHLHLIPLDEGRDFSFRNARDATPAELADMGRRLRARLG